MRPADRPSVIAELVQMPLAIAARLPSLLSWKRGLWDWPSWTWVLPDPCRAVGHHRRKVGQVRRKVLTDLGLLDGPQSKRNIALRGSLFPRGRGPRR